MSELPEFNTSAFELTKQRLRNAALVLGSLQRACLPEEPHEWQHGLDINMRGLSTQALALECTEYRASVDLVRQKFRLEGNNWLLAQTNPNLLFEACQTWLSEHGSTAVMDRPEFADTSGDYDEAIAYSYAKLLWWFDLQFQKISQHLMGGLTSPILLYPHHFDLSLVWFPTNNDHQLGLGFSPGDETIHEPYVYVTASPEPTGYTSLPLPPGAHWLEAGFSGAILPYAAILLSQEPEALLCRFAVDLCNAAVPLLA